MKKIATFTYGLIFAVSMALIALLVVVAIGKYDYKWEYNEKLPSINPEFGSVDTGETTSDVTSSQNDNVKAILSVSDIGHWSYSNGSSVVRFKISETLGGTARISYIEYTLYTDNACYGVLYEDFSDDIRDENAYVDPLSEKEWSANLPLDKSITLVRIRIVWRDSEGATGESFASADYPQA